MKYGLTKNHMEQKYRVDIGILAERVDKESWQVCVYAETRDADPEMLQHYNVIKKGSRVECVSYVLDLLDKPLHRRWLSTHIDSDGQYYMFGIQPVHNIEECAT